MLLIHLLVPAAGIVLFILLDVLRQAGSPASIAGGLLGGVAVVFPTLTGVVCSMAAGQEAEAGNFQLLLTGRNRAASFLGLAVMLLLLGLGAAILTSFGFAAGYVLVRHHAPYGPGFYLCGTLLVYASNIFGYFFHLFLSLRFSKSVSIAIGAAESMLSALLMTGLGDGRWMYIPCAWGLRFLKVFETGGAEPAGYGLKAGITFCCMATGLGILFSMLWFMQWEGKKSEE